MSGKGEKTAGQFLASADELLAKSASELRAERTKCEKLEAALTRAQKLETLGQLTTRVAHDFNNVLATVSGALAVLDRTVTEPIQRDSVTRGRRGVERAIRLIRQLTGFARTQAESSQTFDTNQVLEDWRDLLQPAVGASGRLTINSTCSWRVHADPQQLELALLNLVINARDALGNGGEVEIITEDVASAASGRPDSLQGDQVKISVRDTGPGMSASVLARAKEPFFTTKALGHGTGLGLSMANDFALKSGGVLTLQSEPGNGTTVSIYLPRARVDRVVNSDETIDKTLHGAATVLVVDNDKTVLPIAAQFLRDLGYAVVEAENELHALALVKHAGVFDLVLANADVAGFDTIALTRRLREFNAELPVLFLKENGGTHMPAGAQVLPTPFTEAELARQVLKLLGRGLMNTALSVRIQNSAMRDLYENWRRLKFGTSLPKVEDLKLDACDAAESTFVIEITRHEPFAFRRTRVGLALIDLLGHTPDDCPPANSDANAFGGLQAAYRRCIRSLEPSYESLRDRAASADCPLFERLLLPCSDADGLPNKLVGMVFFETPPEAIKGEIQDV
jgi:nitrogen-specific signal transduction histidine kinase/CheY-like chemotaxis protein